MKAGWVEWATNNGTEISPICLMNNEGVVEDVKEELKNQLTDSQEIAKKVMRNKHEDSVGEIEQIIKKILEENPNIANEPTEIQVKFVCRQKKKNASTEEIIQKWEDFDLPDEGPTMTPQMVEDIDCSMYSNNR